MISIMNGDNELRLLLDSIEEIKQSVIEGFFNNQIDETYWNYGSYVGVHLVSVYYIILRWLNKPIRINDEEGLKESILNSQMVDGSWALGEDPELKSGDMVPTIYNYMALKLMGTPTDDIRMERARDFILSRGGLSSAGFFTKMWLALIGILPWDEIREIPLGPFTSDGDSGLLAKLAQWVKPLLLPTVYIRAREISQKIPGGFNLDELFTEKNKKHVENADESGWFEKLESQGEISIAEDKKAKLRKIIELIIESLQPKGSLGGYTTSTILALIAMMDAQYLFPDLRPKIGEAIEKGFQFIDQLYFREKNVAYKGAIDDGRFWDTALVINSLQNIYDGDELKTKFNKTLQFLLEQQTPHGGFPFGWDFWASPDVDDSALILISLKLLGAPRERIQKTVNWIISMQNDDGGWAAFQKNYKPNIILKAIEKRNEGSISFSDVSCPDITGHVLEALMFGGADPEDPGLKKAIKKAVKYLKNSWDKKVGAWPGRWGVNYLYGTSAALIGLLSVGESPEEKYIKESLQWLIDHQNPDGGWGESIQSYASKEYIGRGISTPTQTAWALLPLIKAGYADDKVVSRGIKYLITEFEKNGDWIDKSVVGTGHPGAMYIYYRSYPKVFPLMVISEYARIKRNSQ